MGNGFSKFNHTGTDLLKYYHAKENLILYNEQFLPVGRIAG